MRINSKKKLDKLSLYLRKIIIDIFLIGQKNRVGGHIGGAFSLVEILRVIYLNFARNSASNDKWKFRDRIILSKGHGCLALYAILFYKGYIKKKDIKNYGKKNSLLGGHPEHFINGVEASTGSLGHGFPIGVGMALAAKLNRRKNNVIIILGDGELNEGSNWEAAMTASKHKLNNLIILVDYNKYQSYGKVDEVSNLNSIKEKFASFGFYVQEVNGHDIEKLKNSLQNTKKNKQKPSAIICHTIKGKGLEEAENNPEWHYVKKIDEHKIQEIYGKLN
jgi:transketolase